MASHGEKRNRIIQIRNNKILENINRKELGIYFEAYDNNIQNKFDKYISDSSIMYNFEWKYGQTPFEAIDNELNSICLLIHPNHWDFNFFKNINKLYIDFKEKIS